MGLLSNRLDRESLKPGDHIYSWRAAYIYAHHGIYVGDEKVIHFTRRGPEVGTASVLDVLTVSSAPPPSYHLVPCANCPDNDNTNGVIISCLDCFLAGGVLYRFEYSAPLVVVLADVLHGGTCTLAASDPPETVLHRANYLLESNDGVGCYNVLNNNCEDFAMYCKTGLIVPGKNTVGRSGQVGSRVNGFLTTIPTFISIFKKANIYVEAVSAAQKIVTDCGSRYAFDFGVRSDLIKVPVEELIRRH